MGNAEIIYAIACSVPAAVHVRDFVRLVDRDYGRHLSEPTANAVLSPDRRFCWAGKGMYALYRHGPLPGPRNLEEASRLILVAADVPLTIDALDYCLKRLGYRYNVASLKNAISRSARITWQRDGRWAHIRGVAAERELRREIPVVPERQQTTWIAMRDLLAHQVREALAQRAERLSDPAIRTDSVSTGLKTPRQRIEGCFTTQVAAVP
jgi:hypothetical protein